MLTSYPETSESLASDSSPPTDISCHQRLADLKSQLCVPPSICFPSRRHSFIFMIDRALNFGAGPSALPEAVLQEATKGLLNFQDTGLGIAEISHRSQEFTKFLEGVEEDIRDLLNVTKETHHVLFTQGGGSTQFSAVVLNMLARHHLLHPHLKPEERMMDYVLTGSWSKKAMEEAKRLGGGTVNVIADARTSSDDGKSFDNIPARNSYKDEFSKNPALIYYCANETVDGVEFNDDLDSDTSFPFDALPDDAPLVGDYSSSFMSRPIPHLEKHAVIYAGAQKNLGPAGLTILIVRKKDFNNEVNLDQAAQYGAIPIPLCLSYKTLIDHKSLYNTPPVLPIYISGLVLKRMKQQTEENGMKGLDYYARCTNSKAAKLYAALKEGQARGVFKGKVREGSASKMNIVFDVVGDGKTAKFITGAEQRRMKGIKGHRSVGGVRVSLYNAVTEQEVDLFVQYMKYFINENSKQ
ncbi:pyridoxal phosphate-dependent transferase [Phlebopus sp. FC_14]|nr:pyridoxal phosphate-dependent transferase [Phlebopus sp. FC_14]